MAFPKKAAACALAFVMAVSAVFAGGCSKKPKGANEVVSADSVWYNTEKYELDLELDLSLIDGNLDITPLGEVGGYLVTESQGYWKFPPGVDMLQLNFVDYYAIFVNVYDKTGDYINSVNVVDMLSHSAIVDDYLVHMNQTSAEEPEEEDTHGVTADDALSSFYVSGLCISGDKIKMNASFVGPAYGSRIEYTVLMDPVTSDITYELTENTNGESEINEGVVSLGEYQVEKIWTHDHNYEHCSYILNIYDDAGLFNTVDLSSKIPGEDLFNIDVILRIDEHTLLVLYYPQVGSAKFLTVDIVSGNVILDENGDYLWLKNYNIRETSYFEGYGNVILDDEGIKTIDYENKTLVEAFNFNACNVNRGDIAGLKLMRYSDDEIIFVGSLYKGSMFHSSYGNPQLIVLTRADSNPNAGKTILTAATVGYIDYAMSEAVCVFNDTSPDYFIRFDYRYKADNHIDAATVDYSDSETYDNAYRAAAVELSNQLAIDLMSGDGPDIIFDTASMSQLNSDDYLLDLSGRLSADGLFENVIDAAHTGDKLYQLPLTFGITGLAVLNEDIGDGQTGFSFDQYDAFVRSVCNGRNPLAMDQTDFFILCMDAMGDRFIGDNGNVDYDNDAFRALAAYTNDHVFPPVTIEVDGQEILLGQTGIYGDPLIDNGALWINSTSFDRYIALLGNHTNEATILGLPSADARGPLLSVSSSVAISAQTAEADACWEFVQTLLSFVVQEYYAESSRGCPILKSAFETFARNLIDDYNMAITDRNHMTLEAMEIYGTQTTEIDHSVIDDYEAMIDSCTAISTTDSAIAAIIREEMPAYFSGQKTLDEVISIMENRVRTFLQERR